MSENPSDDERIEFINKLAQNTDVDPRKVEIPMVLQVGRIQFSKLLKDEPETPIIKALRDSDLIAIPRDELERLQACERKLEAVEGLINYELEAGGHRFANQSQQYGYNRAMETILAAILDAEEGGAE